MSFFDRFRRDLQKYADGVHHLAGPATAGELSHARKSSEPPISPDLTDFYRSFNGVRLFHESIAIWPVDEIKRLDPGTLEMGEMLGLPLLIQKDGRLVTVSESGDRIIVGSNLESWLAAVMAREGLVVDREGEFKDVFDVSGEDLKVEVKKRRLSVALKADPEAAAWHFEAAEIAFDEGEDAIAIGALRRAVELDPDAAEAWELLAALYRRATTIPDSAVQATRAFAAAAHASRNRSSRAERFAEAARAAGSVEAERSQFAAQSVAAAADARAAWLAQAVELLEAGDLAAALNRATLAHAVVASDETRSLIRKIELRQTMRPIG